MSNKDFILNSQTIFKSHNYSVNTENLLNDWIKEAQELSLKHDEKGKYFKFKHEIIGLPPILIPLIYGPLSMIFNFPEKNYIDASVLIVTGLFNGVYKFFDFSKKSELHLRFSAKYEDLISSIKVELSKEPEDRIPADKFLYLIEERLDNLKEYQPVI